MKYDRYQKFRQEIYLMLGKAKDATFELMDSIMTTKNASCLAEFSLSPLFQRKWSSTYEALQDSRPNRNKLMRRYPTFLTPKAIGKAKKLTASRFEPGVRSWVQMTLCYESSCLHQNQLDWAQKAIYLA